MPQNWKTYKLGEVCNNVYSGGTPLTTNSNYYNGSIPWLNTKEVDFRSITSTEKFISEEGLKNSSAKWVPKDAVIIAMYGNTAAKSAITKIPLTTNQACCNLIVDPEKADFRFIYYRVLNDYYLLKDLSNGGAQQNLSAGTIKNYEINLPPLPEQQAIASILSSLDDKIELNLQMNKTLEEMAMTLYKHWFVDFGPFKEGNFIDSELGLIPEGWEVKEFDSIVEVKGGKRLPKGAQLSSLKNSHPYIRVRDFGQVFLSEMGMEYVPDDVFDSISRYITNEGDVILSIVGTIGEVAIVGENLNNASLTENCVKLVLKDNHLSSELIYLHLVSINGKIELRNNTVGSTQPKLPIYNIKGLTIPLPIDKQLIIAVLNELSRVHNLIYSNIVENQTLTTLRDTLLPKLISGEVRVKDAEQTLSEVL